jgi:hypothetical protein
VLPLCGLAAFLWQMLLLRMYQTGPTGDLIFNWCCICVCTRGGLAGMTKRPYQKPVLRRLGLLRELTKYSGGGGGSGGHHWWW